MRPEGDEDDSAALDEEAQRMPLLRGEAGRIVEEKPERAR